MYECLYIKYTDLVSISNIFVFDIFICDHMSRSVHKTVSCSYQIRISDKIDLEECFSV
jgi:hypothetical protein